jgi:hypothetical protein
VIKLRDARSNKNKSTSSIISSFNPAENEDSDLALVYTQLHLPGVYLHLEQAYIFLAVTWPFRRARQSMAIVKLILLFTKTRSVDQPHFKLPQV